MHGDAAFAGQGIWAETLNLAGSERLLRRRRDSRDRQQSDRLYHERRESCTRSRFSSDLAKRQPIPIFHVNAEDPEAVVRVARMATGVSLPVRQRRGDRPDRLSPPWSQRSGRSDHHAAAALQANQCASPADLRFTRRKTSIDTTEMAPKLPRKVDAA